MPLAVVAGAPLVFIPFPKELPGTLSGLLSTIADVGVIRITGPLKEEEEEAVEGASLDASPPNVSGEVGN